MASLAPHSPVKLPDLLATRGGRLTAFFALYMTEGIPLGFTATAIATQMRREGVGPLEIATFVASLYAPWGLKWIAGPFVDVFSSDRWGRRRAWIIGTQLLMVGALLAALPVNFSTQLWWFTVIIYIHNCFCATQDVAIDALACNVLKEDERGLANGLMFAGAKVGSAIGGSGVLYLREYTGFSATFYFVAAIILLVTVFVALPMREPNGPPRAAMVGNKAMAAGREVRNFAMQAARSMFLDRRALIGLFFALLPAGAYGLGLTVQSNLSVELGMSDKRIADLGLITNIIGAAGCVAGGWLSDKLGRKRMLALFVASMSLPAFYLAWVLHQHGWIMPVDPTAADRPIAPGVVVSALWISSMVYALSNGLMYGARSALFMDITNPLVAATQFTAYMACLNFVIAYSAQWQGFALERWGYPITLTIDGIAGIVGLILLPFLGATRRQGSRGPHDPTPASPAAAG